MCLDDVVQSYIPDCKGKGFNIMSKKIQLLKGGDCKEEAWSGGTENFPVV